MQAYGSTGQATFYGRLARADDQEGGSAAAIQLPVHPALTDAALQWAATSIQAMASTSQDRHSP
jgi:hypothetical protein